MSKIKIFAYAKINLTLSVLGKRTDGYHDVEMVMQSIELHDIIQIRSLVEGVSLTVAGADLPAGEENLVMRAVKLLDRELGVKRGVHIHLAKRIPVAAGLGGGSADAAATLVALNMIWRLGLTLPEMMELGVALGSDVPFCLLGGTAIARGRGELLTPVQSGPQMGLVLVKPPFSVSTAQTYNSFTGRQNNRSPDCNAMVVALSQGNLAAVAFNLVNDLEEVTAARHPEISQIKNRLLAAGASGVLMTGSGPTVFGLAPDLASARLVAARYRRVRGEQLLVTQTISPGLQPSGLRSEAKKG